MPLIFRLFAVRRHFGSVGFAVMSWLSCRGRTNNPTCDWLRITAIPDEPAFLTWVVKHQPA